MNAVGSNSCLIVIRVSSDISFVVLYDFTNFIIFYNEVAFLNMIIIFFTSSTYSFNCNSIVGSINWLQSLKVDLYK